MAVQKKILFNCKFKNYSVNKYITWNLQSYQKSYLVHNIYEYRQKLNLQITIHNFE